MTAAAPPQPPADARLLPIDGLRGIAILAVMQYHFWGLPFGLFGREESLAIDGYVGEAVGFGWMSVDLFFVLSGFLITGILLDVKGRSSFFRSFYARRALRIVPVYYLYLAFVIFIIPIVPFFDDGLAIVARPEALREDQFWYWTYLLNIAASLQALDVQPPTVHLHFWTLAVEEQFYIFWPLVVLLCSRVTLTRVCVAMIVGAFVLRFALLEGFASSIFNETAPTILMPAKMDALAFGALVAIAVREGALSSVARYAPLAIGVSLGVLTLLIVRNDGLAFFDDDTARWGFSTIAVLFAACLVVTLRAQPASPLYAFLTNPLLLAFGKYSYAMYVVHLLLSFELARQVAVHGWTRTAAGSHIPFNILFSLAATTLTFGIGWLSWKLLEYPVLAQKRRFAYGPREDPIVTADASIAPAVGPTRTDP